MAEPPSWLWEQIGWGGGAQGLTRPGAGVGGTLRTPVLSPPGAELETALGRCWDEPPPSKLSVAQASARALLSVCPKQEGLSASLCPTEARWPAGAGGGVLGTGREEGAL